MKEEYLKSWLWEAAKEKDPDTEAWEKVVILTQVAFWEGYIPEELFPYTEGWRIVQMHRSG